MLAHLEKISPPSGASFFYKIRRDREFAFDWHFHPEIELTLIVRSRGRRFVGDHIADYSDGDLVLLGPNLPHTWASESAGTHEAVVVQFARAFLGKDFLLKPELNPVRRLLDRSARGIYFRDSIVAKRLIDMARLTPWERLAALLDILHRLSASRTFERLSSPGYEPSLRPIDRRRTDRVCGYIHRNYRRGVSLDRAAATARMTVPAFCRYFKRTTGRTFTDYVNELRVGWACRRLTETDDRILDICYDAGFNNLSNFNRRFRELKGLAPREFRRSFDLHPPKP
jgi:AraC-like DNA-binding protein